MGHLKQMTMLLRAMAGTYSPADFLTLILLRGLVNYLTVFLPKCTVVYLYTVSQQSIITWCLGLITGKSDCMFS